MQISKTLNRNPVVAATIAGAAIAVGVFLIIRAIAGNAEDSGGKAFFTTDDGKTWFKDEMTKPFPFDHDGAPAYRVNVFRCGDGQPFAGYLECLPSELVDAVNSAGPSWVARYAKLQTVSDQILVKKPGDAEWTKPRQKKEYARIIKPVCPDGTKLEVTPVNPNQ